MERDPWTDPDPQPGDFDGYLDAADPGEIELRPGDAAARLTIVVGIEGDDAVRLQELAARDGTAPAEVISRLLRHA